MDYYVTRWLDSCTPKVTDEVEQALTKPLKDHAELRSIPEAQLQHKWIMSLAEHENSQPIVDLLEEYRLIP